VLDRIVRPASLAGLPRALRARVVLTSQIALLLIGITAIGVPANILAEDRAMVAGSLLLLVIVAGTPALVAAGRFDAARLLLVLGGPAALMGPALLGGGVAVANLSALPYAVLTMSLLPALVFEPREERRMRAGCNAYLGIVVAGHDLVLARLGGLPAPPLNAKLAQLVLWLLVLATVRFIEQRGGDDETES